MQVPEMLRVPLDGLILQIKLLGLGEPSDFLGTHFTCFTSTKVQIVAQKCWQVWAYRVRRLPRYSLYLLY